MKKPRTVGALDSFTPPQEYFSCANRSPGFASSYWDAFPLLGSGFVSVRPLHGYWGSPEFSSVFPWWAYAHQRPHRAQMRTLFI